MIPRALILCFDQMLMRTHVIATGINGKERILK